VPVMVVVVGMGSAREMPVEAIVDEERAGRDARKVIRKRKARGMREAEFACEATKAPAQNLLLSLCD